MTTLIMKDRESAQDIIRQRQKQGIDLYDEVWEGVYVMPSLPSTAHQRLVSNLTVILYEVTVKAGIGEVFPGANVSDRRKGWKKNFRVPDVVVVLKDSQAVDCDSFLFGGPDFLVEIQSPGDDTLAKLPFYSQIRVQELLVIHRDTRALQLYRFDGQELAAVPLTIFQEVKWLVSEVVPLAFRRAGNRNKRRMEVQRTDGGAGRWTV